MIIYEDNNKPKEPIRVTCVKCKSILGVEDKDIIKIDQFDQREGVYKVDGFKCPLCKSKQRLRL